MANRAPRQPAPSKPRYLLTASGEKDYKATLIPRFYSESRAVPAAKRPFTCVGAPGLQRTRSEAPARPTTSHSEVFNSKVFPQEFGRTQILDRSSPHLYSGRYAKPTQWIWGRDGTRKFDDRKMWTATNKFPTLVNPHAAAGASSWAQLRPTVSKSLVQMGVYYTSRL